VCSLGSGDVEGKIGGMLFVDWWDCGMVDFVIYVIFIYVGGVYLRGRCVW